MRPPLSSSIYNQRLGPFQRLHRGKAMRRCDEAVRKLPPIVIVVGAPWPRLRRRQRACANGERAIDADWTPRCQLPKHSDCPPMTYQLARRRVGTCIAPVAAAGTLLSLSENTVNVLLQDAVDAPIRSEGLWRHELRCEAGLRVERALYGMNEDPAKVTYSRMAPVKRGQFAATVHTKSQ